MWQIVFHLVIIIIDFVPKAFDEVFDVGQHIKVMIQQSHGNQFFLEVE